MALAIGCVLAGSAIAAVVLHRRRRAKGASMVDAKDIVKRLFEEPWKGNFEVFDEFVSPDYIGHDPAEPEPIRGPAGARANIEKYLAGFPGGAITVDEQIAEGDTVATRWTGRGTHGGEVAGIAPTGKDVTVTGVTISRIIDGKVVVDWTSWDTLGMLVQLGAIQEPARA
jgi:predicted ester cyclase